MLRFPRKIKRSYVNILSTKQKHLFLEKKQNYVKFSRVKL
jgi:hypothetical protein